jgi:Hpr(Ser) kinase/phosphatase/PTS IIA-like nitrogen-regulatory protein PtsN
LFENNQGIGRSTVFDSLFAREKLGSTGLGQGVAIPHGRIKGLKEAVGAFLRLAAPVQFDAPDGKPVNLLFVLLVPEQATEQHLQILSELAQMFSDRAFREQLAAAADAAAIHALFTGWEGPCSRRASRSCLSTTGTAAAAAGQRQPRRTHFAVNHAHSSPADLVGHLNLIHPDRIQVIGAPEINWATKQHAVRVSRHMEEIIAAHPPAVIVADGCAIPAPVREACEKSDTALFSTPHSAAVVIDLLRMWLSRQLAETVELHAVMMDVLGMGVLITGDSGVGKSELALELISRGHGLVADDIVEIARVSPNTLEARCPPMLKDFLEVRGLGVLNIRTVFGETACRRKMKLKLIVNLPSRSARRRRQARRSLQVGLCRQGREQGWQAAGRRRQGRLHEEVRSRRQSQISRCSCNTETARDAGRFSWIVCPPMQRVALQLVA